MLASEITLPLLQIDATPVNLILELCRVTVPLPAAQDRAHR